MCNTVNSLSQKKHTFNYIIDHVNFWPASSRGATKNGIEFVFLLTQTVDALKVVTQKVAVYWDTTKFCINIISDISQMKRHLLLVCHQVIDLTLFLCSLFFFLDLGLINMHKKTTI